MSHTFTDIEEGSIVSSHQLDENFKYLDDRATSISSSLTSLSSTVSSLTNAVTDLQSQEILTPTATAASDGVNIQLTNNSVHSVTISNKTTFLLPSPTSGILNQMLVLMYMPTVKTIVWSAGNKFGGYTPDTSRAGKYTVIYEHNGTYWTVGAIYKS